MTPFKLFRRHVFVMALSTVCLLPAARADGLQDASKLLKQGQAPQALEQVDTYLSAHPKDPSGRFLRGVILTELNRSSEAMAIFTKLTEDYPDLPEPYNNLAYIYAQQKQYDKAKSALEAAIRTHPSYATAHENLGDIYARLASQAYDKALQLDSNNKAAQTKLSMIRDLMTVSSRSASTTVIAAAKPVEATKPITPPTLVASKPVEVAKLGASPLVVATVEPIAPEPKPVSKPINPTKPIAPTKPEPSSASTDDDAARVLASWAESWSHKDAKAYLGFYASDFKTPGGESRSAWATERTKRVTKPGPIHVTIEGARVTPEGSNVVVRFRQHYKSASLSTSANKTLLMTRQNGQWKILQERIGG